MYPYEKVGDLYYGPLNTIAEKYLTKDNYRFNIEYRRLLNKAIPEMEKDAECLEWFFDHWDDSVTPIFDDGMDEYDSDEIESMIESAYIEANIFQKYGYNKLANEIRARIDLVEREYYET